MTHGRSSPWRRGPKFGSKRKRVNSLQRVHRKFTRSRFGLVFAPRLNAKTKNLDTLDGECRFGEPFWR